MDRATASVDCCDVNGSSKRELTAKRPHIIPSADALKAKLYLAGVKPDLTRHRYSPQSAYFFAALSTLAYKDEAEVRRVVPGGRKEGGLGYTFFRWFERDAAESEQEDDEDETTEDTQAFVAADDDMIVVVFRGSQEGEDWVSNFKFIPTTPPDSWGVPRGAIHCGFNNGVATVWEDWEGDGDRDGNDRVQGMLRTIRELSDGKRKLFVAGHSLGGALATVAAARLVFEEKMKLHGMYTIGSPRVFDTCLAKAFNKKMNGGEHLRNKCFRIRNNNDIVPHVPPCFLLEYRHVGTEIYFDRHGMRSASSLSDSILGYLEAAVHQGSFIDGIRDHSGEDYVKVLHDAMLKTRDAVVKPVERVVHKTDQKTPHLLGMMSLLGAAVYGMIVKLRPETTAYRCLQYVRH